MRRAALTLATVSVLVLGTASVASAIPPILREGTRPMWAQMNMGFIVGVRDPEFEYQGHKWEGKAPDQFMLTQTWGYHFSGNASGPAIAVDLQESFGDDFDIVFQIVPKFVWDIRIKEGLGVYLSPIGGLGFVTAKPDCPSGADCDNWNGVVFQMGFEGKMILADRGMVCFRPFHLEIAHTKTPSFNTGFGSTDSAWGTSVRYGILFGGGVIF